MPRVRSKTTKCFPNMKLPTPKELGPKDTPRELRILSRRVTDLWKRIDRFTKLAVEIKLGTDGMQDILEGIEGELIELRLKISGKD